VFLVRLSRAPIRDRVVTRDEISNII
jgi:hypothetical protein